MVRAAPLLVRGLVLLFALALAATGLGHRFASAAERERAQYTQMFGADFCLTDEGDSAVDTAGCPVCHLITSIYLPDVVTGAPVPVFALIARAGAGDDHLLLTATAVARPTQRGPPLI